MQNLAIVRGLDFRALKAEVRLWQSVARSRVVLTCDRVARLELAREQFALVCFRRHSDWYLLRGDDDGLELDLGGEGVSGDGR